jgi:hypothetical protein
MTRRSPEPLHLLGRAPHSSSLSRVRELLQWSATFTGTAATPDPNPELMKPQAKTGVVVAIPVFGGVQYDNRRAE